MAAVNLKALVGKLNQATRHALEGAAGLTLSRSHYNVEVEHWLIKLLETSGNDFDLLLSHYGIDTSRLTRDLMQVLDRLKTGNSRAPALSPQIVDLAREAWLLASLEFDQSATRSGHLLCALLSDDALNRQIREASQEFAKIPSEDLRNALPSLTADSSESTEAVSLSNADRSGPTPASGPSRTPSLDQFTVDLVEQARSGSIDPVLGRDNEIRQIIDILMRRRQNNPILTGEAGVGKTAVVEGLALRLVAGDVPETLQKVSIRCLDLALLQAGAGVKGEFENRLKSVINEVKSSPRPIILFIDEAHTLIGAGGQAGQGDAANLLKPALARGELRTIAATTWAEYKKFFERDAALTRRFQVVKIEEPNEDAAIAMLRGLVETLEAHHGVRILDEAVANAVRLSHRYVSGRQLPDKAVSVLDTTCARVAIGQNSVPASVEDRRWRLTHLGTAIQMLEREAVTDTGHEKRLAEIREEVADIDADRIELEQRWQTELALVQEIRSTRDRLETVAMEFLEQEGDTPTQGEEQAALRTEYHQIQDRLKSLQGEVPLVPVNVDAQAVAETIATWTGIPLGNMVTDEINAVLNLRARMEERLIGQSHALEVVARTIKTARANLLDPRHPIGVFLLVGPSGIGKTETAVILSDLLYGGEQNMAVINMSEFKEEHKVSLLMGAPPGYVGYGEGGVLTEAVRRKPYSIVLLDEMEKAHAGVQDIFYQVFDKGTLRDGEGRDVDFKNTVIIMTSNAASDAILKYCADPTTAPDAETLTETLHPELTKTFKPAFLGRVTVIPYYPLDDAAFRMIVRLKLDRIGLRIGDTYDARFHYSDELVDSIAARCREVETGARNVDHILNRTLLPELSAEFLSRMAEGQAVSEVGITIGEHGGFLYEIS